MENLTLTQIEKIIYVIRGQRVMRDIDRFPEDFTFQLNSSELAELSLSNHVKFTPFLFTENAVVMLSSVLNSSYAVQVNISIMRIFTKLRSFLIWRAI